MENVKFILKVCDIENEINSLKIQLFGDSLIKHKVIEEGAYTVIKMYSEDKLTSSQELFYGKVYKDFLYIGRYQFIKGIEFHEINLRKEFKI